jgi:hypothetical protein
MIGERKTVRLPRRYLVGLVSLLGLAVFVVGSGAVTTVAACAVASPVNHLADSNFEVDAIIPPPANAKKNTLPTGGANLKKNGGTGCIDWGVVADSKQPDATTGSNDNSFGQGTSENDAVPTIVSDSIPPNKSDLLNFGVYEELAGTRTFVALYWARINSPSGTTNMDFELNQNSCDPSKPPTATPPGNLCSSNGVTPVRRSGDKLLIFNLSSGGTAVDILIRTWDGSAWVGETALNSTQALGSINYDALSTAADNDGLGVLDSLTFGEVVVDFQALLGSNQTCGSFGSVYLKSRSSDSFSAEMKDFIAPKPVTLTNCTAISTSATTTTPVGNSISDTATLTNANSPTGGATFKLYSDASCTTLVTTLTGSNWSGSGGTYTSTATYPSPAVGTYYWIASYAGDVNNSSATGKCGDAGEQSDVTKRSPTIGTTPSAGGKVGVVVLNDTATLSGAFNPTGSVTFKLFDPSQTCPTDTPVFTQTVALTGASATTTLGPTANKAGTWRWVASWPGDANNNGPVTSGCTEEEVTVTKATPTLSTTPNPTSGTVGVTALNDSATLSGGFSPTGSIVFSLWDPDQTCGTGTPRFSVSVALTANSATTTTGPVADKVGTWRWTASYAGDANNDPASSPCTAELVTIAKAPSTISTAQTVYPNDSATVGGTTGAVTFELYGPFADAASVVCSGTAKFSQTVAQSNGAAQTTNYPGASGVTAYGVVDGANSTEGWYGWRVTAAEDATHEGRRSACNEKVNITITDYAGTGVKFP